MWLFLVPTQAYSMIKNHRFFGNLGVVNRSMQLQFHGKLGVAENSKVTGPVLKGIEPFKRVRELPFELGYKQPSKLLL